MKVCLLKNDEISSVELPQKIQGQYWLYLEGKDSIAIEGIGNEWVLKPSKHYVFETGETKISLQKNMVYQLKNGNHDSIFVYVENEHKDTVYLKYKLKFKDEIISLGRSKDNTICVNDSSISNHHLDLIYHQKKWILQDHESTNGTFVNNHKVDKCDLHIGDVVYVLGVNIIIGNGFISLSSHNAITVNSQELELMTFKNYSSNEEIEENEFDYFYRSPRIKRDIQTKKIQIDSPPENKNQEEMPFILVLGPSMTMGMASISTAFFAINNAISNGGNISSAMPSIVMSLSMLLGTIMWPILSKKYEKKKKNENEEKRQIKYGRYLDLREKEIAQCANEQAQIWNENFPSIEQCVLKIKDRDRTLFERSIKHNDFLELRVGLGKRKVDLDIQYSRRNFSLIEDSLKERLYSICEKEKIIDNVPITISLLKQDVLGIVGNENARNKLLINLITQIISYYSYEEVKLVLTYNEEDHQYDDLKWLPFVFDNQRENRFVARNITELKELSNYFDNVISSREKLDDKDIQDQIPYYIILSLDDKLSSRAEFMKRISKEKNNLHFSIVYACQELKNLPNECKCVIEVESRNACYYDLNDMTGYKTYFIPDQDHVHIGRISKELANIHLESQKDNFNLPEMVTFLQMYGVGKIEHLNALDRWKENNPTISLEAPVGVDKLGGLFKLDLHQKYHGPHGLVAGMTGSGKSEFIMTYILSLALNYHPYEVAFILIDYKGGGMAKAFETLPHTCGVITNLDGSMVKRSLISIDSELKRRQGIFNEVGKTLGISNLDIYKYQNLYRKKQVQEPLQHLFIISDEFAELKTQQPEFMEQLISAARIGRSLGVHLILATQKPSGVVDDQIWSNSRFRVCLKVQEKADSIDMLKRPDAAEIAETGRFYLQVGYNEFFDLGQSAWAGAPYYPSDRVAIEKDDSVCMIDMSGHTIQSSKIDKRQTIFKSANKQLDEITNYLCHIAEEEKIKVRPLWLDPIPEKIYIDELILKYQYQNNDKNVIEAVIGEYDDPTNQSQGLLTLSMTQGGNTIIYGINGSGKTTYLSTFVYSLIHQYTAREINIYILDFSSETLRAFKDAPQVGDVLISSDEEKITNLMRMLKKELEKRKNDFVNYGGDILSYNRESGKTTHSIIVLINNFTAFLEIYENYEDDIVYLSREGERYGIYFILTANATNGIRFRILQNFSQQYCLLMNDESDYFSIVGKTNGIFPAKYKGRGLVKIEDSVYEFQTAHISKTINSYKNIKAYCQSLKNQSIFVAKHIPVLPDVVSVDFIQPYLQNQQPLFMPIGVNTMSLEPYYYDFSKRFLHFIIGQGYMNMMKAMIEILKMNKQKTYFFNLHEDIPKIENFTFYNTKEEMMKGIDELFEVVLTRNNTYKSSNSKDSTIETFDQICIVVSSLSELLTMFTGETNEKLELILKKGQADYHVHMIVFENIKNVSLLSYASWFKTNVDVNHVIWYGNGLGDQYIFTIHKKNNDLYENLSDMFGYVVEDGVYKKVKFINYE